MVKQWWYNKTTPRIQPYDTVVYIDIGKAHFFKFCCLILVMFSVSEMLCIFLIYLILTTLRDNTAVFSGNTHKLHMQLTLLLATQVRLRNFFRLYILVVQLLTPFVCIFGPLIACIIATLLRAPVTELATQLGLLGFVFYGFANSLLTIVFVSPYRAHCSSTFILPWLRPLMTKTGFDYRLSKPHAISPLQSNTVQPT